MPEETQETAAVPVQTPEEKKREFVAALRERFPDAPTYEKLDEWKRGIGRVRFFPFSDDEIYFFRPFRNAEFKGWVQSLQQTAQSNPAVAEELLKERILSACILWPPRAPEDISTMFAGTIDTLVDQIREASNFIAPQEAAMMVGEW